MQIQICFLIFNGNKNFTPHGFQDDILLDSDGDSLDNIREMIEGTDPYIADSDGDGVLDGEEVAQGSDPLDQYERAPPSQEADICLTGLNNLLCWYV